MKTEHETRKQMIEFQTLYNRFDETTQQIVIETEDEEFVIYYDREERNFRMSNVLSSVTGYNEIIESVEEMIENGKVENVYIDSL